MHHFSYRDGVLCAEDVPLPAIARAVGTPFYCYSSATIERHFEVFRSAFAGQDSLVCYAMKANSNQAVIATLARLGAGMDVVSEGELRRARAAGVPSEPDHLFRRRQDRGRNGRSGSMRRSSASTSSWSPSSKRSRPSPPPAARSLRSPSASTPTSTRAPTPRSPPASRRTSSACRSRAPARSMPAPAPCPAFRSAASTCISARRSPTSSRSTTRSRFWPISSGSCAPTGTRIDHVDLGGGLGIPYRADNNPPPFPEAYAEIVARHTKGLDCRIYLEPGRLIVGNAGVLVASVIFVKRRRRQELRHRRCGDERSRAPDALRRPSRHPARPGAGAPRRTDDPRRRGRPGLRKRRLSSPSTATSPRSPRATSSRS